MFFDLHIECACMEPTVLKYELRALTKNNGTNEENTWKQWRKFTKLKNTQRMKSLPSCMLIFTFKNYLGTSI